MTSCCEVRGSGSEVSSLAGLGAEEAAKTVMSDRRMDEESLCQTWSFARGEEGISRREVLIEHEVFLSARKVDGY